MCRFGASGRSRIFSDSDVVFQLQPGAGETKRRIPRRLVMKNANAAELTLAAGDRDALSDFDRERRIRGY